MRVKKREVLGREKDEGRKLSLMPFLMPTASDLAATSLLERSEPINIWFMPKAPVVKPKPPDYKAPWLVFEGEDKRGD